jgi:hypothetical protein
MSTDAVSRTEMFLNVTWPPATCIRQKSCPICPDTLYVDSFILRRFSVTRLYNVDNRVIREWWWIGKDLLGSGRGLILSYYSGIRLEWLRQPRKICHVAGRRCRDLNEGRPKYLSVQNKMFETRVLYEPYTWPQCDRTKSSECKFNSCVTL